MKKIQRSLYKKKKNSKSDPLNSHPSEQVNKSAMKSPFGQSLKKKFFSGKSMSRSQSVPEGPISPVLNGPPNRFISVESNDVFTAENVPEENGSSSPCIEAQDHPQSESKDKFSGVERSSQEQQTYNFSEQNGFHLPATINSASGGDMKSFESPNDNFETKSNLLPPTKEEVFSNSDNLLLQEDHIYDHPPDDILPASSNQEHVFSSHLPLSQYSHSASYHKEGSPASTTHTKFFVPSSRPRVVSKLTTEFQRLATQGWYWGPLTRPEAEDKLDDVPDGSFLVRDSSDERYLLSLSFRSFGRTLHTRIEHSHGKFSFYANTSQQTYTSVVDLIDHSMQDSEESGVFCYSRSNAPYSPTLPVFLTHPISRLSQVRTLRYLCRFVIRQYTRIDHIEQLPLPVPVKGYLNQSYF